MNQQQREDLVGKRELRGYEESGALTADEALRVVDCRENFLQKASSGGRVALLLWLKYELKFEKLMKIRGAKLKKRMPPKVANLLIKRFPSEIRIWATAIEVNARYKKKQQHIIAAALKLHPSSAWLWRTAARATPNKSQKKILLQRGLRLCPKPRKLLRDLLHLIQNDETAADDLEKHTATLEAFKKSALLHFGQQL